MGSVREALRAFEDLVEQNEAAFVIKERELLGIFDSAEVHLWETRANLLTQLKVDVNGKLVGTAGELARVESLIEQIQVDLRPVLINPAHDWVDDAMPLAFKQGRGLARVSLTHDLIDEGLVGQAFAHVLQAEAGVLSVGVRDNYKIMNVVGDDIGEFFRRELTEAMILGLPVQGKGSLAERLYESGRIKPLTVKGKDGKIHTRSMKQRSVSIARIETNKVINRVEEIKVEEVLGDEAVYININPEDNRTTNICDRASRSKPLTLEEWDAGLGRPPRLRPDFHLCRSVLFGATDEMLEQAGHVQQKARRKRRAAKKPVKKAPVKKAAPTPPPVKPEPLPEVPKFKSLKAAETWATDNITMAEFTGWKGTRLAEAQDTVEAISEIQHRLKKHVPLRGHGKWVDGTWKQTYPSLKTSTSQLPDGTWKTSTVKIQKPRLTVQFGGVSGTNNAHYAWNNLIAVKKRYVKKGEYNTLAGQKALNPTYTHEGVSGIPWVVTRDLKETVWHEMGHAVDYGSNKELSTFIQNQVIKFDVTKGAEGINPKVLNKVSEYGNKNFKEIWAEAFAAVANNSPRVKMLHPTLIQMVKERID
jgi:hypothetical protein